MNRRMNDLQRNELAQSVKKMLLLFQELQTRWDNAQIMVTQELVHYRILKDRAVISSIVEFLETDIKQEK